ncbi:MAG: hypothetical protein LBS67_03640 [Clostridiales Family XIII bacterium]|jgi:hypothetical protein|nr:hypothetical protein [Clostridiales Family XIII bacterium]
MQLLLTHWHCIVPAVAILIGLALMSKKSGRRERGTPENGERAKEQ